MNDKPLVSIIVPVYNVEKYLAECLDSIINQTYSNLEIILVDDGSPDKCGEICDKYAVSDSRIKVIHKKNGGVSSARNVGIEISTGEWIYFMDSDDTIEKDLISEVLITVLTDGTDMCFFDYDNIYDKKIINQTTLNSNESVFRNINNIKTLTVYFSKLGYIWNFIVKSKLIKNKFNFDETLFFCEDEIFKFRLYNNISSFSYLHKVFYHYRILSDSAVGQFLKKKDYSLVLYKLYYKFIDIIKNGNYPDNAVIIPNTRLINNINVVVNIAFDYKFSLKCDYDMIKNYLDTDEYRKARLNYDKDNIWGLANKLYFFLKKPNRFFITLIYLLNKIKTVITKRNR